MEDHWRIVAEARRERIVAARRFLRSRPPIGRVGPPDMPEMDNIPHKERIMIGIASMTYGLFAYGFFLAVFLYAIAFVGNFPVPRTIDVPPGDAGEPIWLSIAVNGALLAIFALQHSVMARPAFKRWWTKIVPKPAERSTYVLFASLALALLLWQWRPIAAPVWSVTNGVAVAAIQAVFWLGWITALVSTCLIDHFELFGLRQVNARLWGHDVPGTAFRTPGLYRLVRHPIYLGFLMAFWAAPVMTAGHLFFAAGITGYILIGIRLEERDLVTSFGGAYCRYRQTVPMLLPGARIPGGPRSTEASDV